jgi:hypothetical protein
VLGGLADVLNAEQVGVLVANVCLKAHQRDDFAAGAIHAVGRVQWNQLHGTKLAGRPVGGKPYLAKGAFPDGPQ